MQDDPKAQDPLLRAISELRDHLDRLIDEQRSFPGGAEGAEPAEAYAAVAEFAPKPRRMTAIAAHERAPEPARPEPAPPDVAPDGRASDDPRLRLDALAKHLDRKMRQASAPAADPSGRPPA